MDEIIKNALAFVLDSRFIAHYDIISWGVNIMIMEKNGKAFGRLYWYHDNPKTVYLDMLSVDKDIRDQGIGTLMQIKRENIGKNLGAIYSCLWVKKDTWMHEWYKRRDYEDWLDHETEENAIWMRKSLI